MEDSSARRNFISNCLGILRATKGRGLVVSSEAKSALGVRAPADVINLLAVWGLGRESGIESLGVNPRGVVVNEGLKRSSFRGVVDVIEGGETKAVNDAETGNEKGKETNGSGIGKKYMGKRKPEEINGEDTAQISKRQAKKLRLAALKAGKEPASKESTPTKEAVTTKESYTPSTTKNKANG